MGKGCAGYDPTSHDAVFQYCPSLPAAIIFTVVFGVSTFVHIFQGFHYKKWRICWVIAFGTLWQAVAFGFRAKASQDPTVEAFSIPSIMLIFLAPLLINAFAYMVLGRMVWYYLSEKRVCGITAQKFTVIFVWLDVFAFVVQYAGAMLTSIREDDEGENGVMTNKQQIGIYVYMAGLGVQLSFILIFSAVAWRFRTKAVIEEARNQGTQRETSWRRLLMILYITLGMIIIRIIFRLVEFSGGIYSSVLTSTEAFIYVLEALPMAIASILWNVFHPGSFFIGPDSEFPRKTRAEKKAAKMEKKRIKEEKKNSKKTEKEAKKHSKRESKRNNIPLTSGPDDIEMGRSDFRGE